MGKTNLKPGLTINFREGCVSIGKDVIRALKEPKFISIMKNDEKKTLLIIPCGEYDPLSFRVPNNLLSDHNKVLRIYSLQFINELKEAGGFAGVNYVRLHGSYDEEMGSVIFRFGED